MQAEQSKRDDAQAFHASYLFARSQLTLLSLLVKEMANKLMCFARQDLTHTDLVINRSASMPAPVAINEVTAAAEHPFATNYLVIAQCDGVRRSSSRNLAYVRYGVYSALFAWVRIIGRIKPLRYGENFLLV